MHVLEVRRGGKSDPDQLVYAVSQGRAIVTHNIRDYLILDQAYQRRAKEHYGIILSDQVSLRELLRRTLRALAAILRKTCTTASSGYRIISDGSGNGAKSAERLAGAIPNEGVVDHEGSSVRAA